MALRCKLRSLSIHHHRYQRYLSSYILNPDSTTPLTSKEKSRAALSLLRSESNAERILEICRAASLTPESHLDRIAYSKAISKLKSSNYFDGIRALLEESKERPDFRSERFISHFIVLYGQAGMLDDAIQTFHRVPDMGIKRTVKTLNSLLVACILAGNYGEMKRVFMEFPGKYEIMPNVDTYNTVIKGFVESNSSSSFFSLLAEMGRKGIKPNATTFANGIEGFYKEMKFDDVGKVLELMKQHNVSPGMGIYNVRIKALCKLGKSVEAKALFEGILSRGMKANNETYNNLILGFCKEGHLEEAKGLFKRMVNSGIQPNSECYFTLAYFLCKGGNFETALKVCKECMAKGWVPNFSTMKLLVDGLVSISKVDEARKIIGKLKENFSRNADRWTEIEEGLPK